MSIFTKVAKGKHKTSNFNLSEEMKLSCNFGDLVPILCKEVLPGDRFNISTELMIKLAPLKAPVMHKLNAYVHYFYVPNFQVTNVFEKFINPKVNTSSQIVLPYLPARLIGTYGKTNSDTGSMIGSLADYLGLPVTQSGWLSSDRKVSVLPFMVYQHVYNSYYRDENLELVPASDPTAVSQLYPVELYKDLQGSFTGNGYRIGTLLRLRKRAWAKDYFTSALPSPQAGDDVLLPVTTGITANGPMEFSVASGGNTGLQPTEGAVQSGVSPEPNQLRDYADNPMYYEGGLQFTNSTTINDLRKAMALQRFKELAERGGTRYSEFVQNFWDTYLPDYWVDRPIFLGGQKQPIPIGEVFQTSQNTGSSYSGGASALGERGGYANSYGKTKTVSFKAPANGFVIGILSIRPDATYSQGVERMWTRESIFDFAFPQFANMGEQEIRNQEIFAQGTDVDDGVFGYTPRYAEYKHGNCHIAGEFRNTLSYWHFGRNFSNLPTLSKQFVQMDNVSYDPFNVTDSSTEHIYVDLYNSIFARRKLPYFGTPKLL